MKSLRLIVPAVLFGLAACAAVSTAVTNFEAKAAPVVADACAKFHAAEANPAVQLAVAAATTVGNVETAGAAGPIVATVKSFGDQFCAAGPPAGDTTTAPQQAAWLAGVVQQMLGAAGVK